MQSNKKIVVNLTEIERRYLINNPIIRVQNDGNYPPFNYFIDGKPSGYSIDLIELLANMLGIKVKLIIGKSWTEYMAMLKNKELDVLVNIIDLESRHEFAGFTSPYAKIDTFAVSRKSEFNSTITKDSLSGKRIAITKGYAVNDKLRKNLPNSTFIMVKDTMSALTLVSRNQADVYFEVGAVVNYYITKNLMANLKLVPVSADLEVVNQKYSIATHKDNQTLLNILQKAINAIPDIEHISLKRKWFGEKYISSTKRESFTDKELEFIAKSSFTLCRTNPDLGSPMVIPVIDLINLGAGLNISMGPPLQWSEALKALENHECDILLEVTKTAQRSIIFNFTPEYFRDKLVIVTKKKKSTILDIYDHLSETFGVLKGSSLIPLLKKHYPNIKLTEVNSTIDGFDLVNKAAIYGYVNPSIFTDRLFKEHKFENLKINAHLRAQFDDLQSIATRKSNKLLHSILSKAVNNVDKETLTALILKSNNNEESFQFNKNEQNYLKSNQIVWCVSDNADAWDELMSYLTKDTGMTLVKSKNMTWHLALTSLINGECDVLPEATETEERSKTMNFTQSIHQEERVIVTRNQQRFIADIRDYLDKEFVLHRGDIVYEQLKTGYPTIKIKLVDYQNEGLNLVNNGEAFAYIGSITDTGNTINKFSIKGLKIAGTLSDKYNDSWSLATRKTNPILSGIFAKIIDNADKNKIRKIISGQLSVKYDKGFDYRLFWQMLFIALAILTAILFWNRRLAALNNALNLSKKVAEDAQKQVESQHHELLTTHQQLLQSEKMASLGTLTAGVAHEINNPTNFTYAAVYMMQSEIEEIKAFLKQLAGGDNADADVINSFDEKFKKLTELAKTASEGTERIKVIVEDLRTFARLDDAKQAQIHVSELITSTVHLVKTQFDNISIKTKFEYDPVLTCFPSKLNQVFMNIIVNACQSIKTKIKQNKELDSNYQLEGLINISTSVHDDYLIINVIDNGCGMDKLTQQKVCEPFFTTKDVGSGTGLGMAISFGIIEEHDGMLKIASKLNKGSDFSIYLPINTDSTDNKKIRNE
ncbi:MAG: transporter substrate-binding domain-containing protein [Colwellia sp.]|nr:transporter substrate-binding domain-containing protein [Colwellia sp.]